MSLINEETVRQASSLQVAKKMMTAARTAPKAKGRDNLYIAVVDEKTKDEIGNKMIEMSSRESVPDFFGRDGRNVLNADQLIIIATKISPFRIEPCGLCGYKNCDEKLRHLRVPCAFNTCDMGIAIGSAVSVAMDERVDNRIMYTVGKAAMELKLLDEEYMISMGIPLSISGKNIFFDRKQEQ
jgi:uncharacterized ferredoxin-like protein